MPKAVGEAGKARKVKSNLKAAGKLTRTFICACTSGCKGRSREISEALYKKHAKFRELDEATDKGNVGDLESVSFQL